MIKVSDAWKEAHKQMILPESFVEISMDISNTDVSGTVSGSNVASFANASSIINADKKTAGEPYVTLEHNRWLLDCSNEIAPDVSSLKTNTRYVSADSSSSTATISLSSTGGEIPGVTITWSREYNEYATAFTVTAKYGSTVRDTVTVTNNKSVISTIDMPLSSYNTLVITISEWSVPDHRHRIDSVKFGQMLVFDKNQIISYTHEMSGDPLGTELSRNAIEFEVDNSDARWNILNPSGMAKYLYEQQRLVVHYGLQLDSGIEWIQAGVFYLSEWKAPANGMTATFVARDVIGFMLNTIYSRSYLEGKITYTIPVHHTKDDVYSFNSDDEYTAIQNEEGIATLRTGTSVRVYEWDTIYHGDDLTSINDGWPVYRVDQGWVNGYDLEITSSTDLDVDINAALNSCLPEGVNVENYTDFSMNTRPISIERISVAEFLQQCVVVTANTMFQGADGTLYIGAQGGRYDKYDIPLSLSYSHPEIELTKPLKEIHLICHYQHTDRTTTHVYEIGDTGETIVLDSPYFHEDHRWVMLPDEYEALWSGGKLVSGEYRADPRLELFDLVTIETKYGVSLKTKLTNIKYTYNGSFHCTYSGRVYETVQSPGGGSNENNPGNDEWEEIPDDWGN